MMKTMMDKIDKLTSHVEMLVMKEEHPAGNAGVKEEMSGERSKPAALDGVIRNTPHDGPRTLPPRSDEEQQSTGLHEEEQSQAPASRPGDSNKKGSNPGGESIRGGLVHDTVPSKLFDT